jgi:hypothetical protein
MPQGLQGAKRCLSERSAAGAPSVRGACSGDPAGSRTCRKQAVGLLRFFELLRERANSAMHKTAERSA